MNIVPTEKNHQQYFDTQYDDGTIQCWAEQRNTSQDYRRVANSQIKVILDCNRDARANMKHIPLAVWHIFRNKFTHKSFSYLLTNFSVQMLDGAKR